MFSQFATPRRRSSFWKEGWIMNQQRHSDDSSDFSTETEPVPNGSDVIKGLSSLTGKAAPEAVKPANGSGKIAKSDGEPLASLGLPDLSSIKSADELRREAEEAQKRQAEREARDREESE